MKLTKDKKILIIGLGVMGGSYAKALSKKGYRVFCITKNQEDIDYAISNKMIEYGTTDIDPNLIGDADIVVFALYPHIFIEWIRENQRLFKPGALITDVTGVKKGIVETVQSILRPDVEFISAHPMAGRERSGVLYSDDAVFRGANFIVVPTEKNSAEAIGICKSLGEELGFADISELNCDEHDEMIAFLSQLTHCIAVNLMVCNDGENLEKYTGDSFRDLTRIAKINDAMWSELFMLNREKLLRQMDLFSASFAEMRRMIAENDTASLREKMREATQKRTKFDKKV